MNPTGFGDFFFIFYFFYWNVPTSIKWNSLALIFGTFASLWRSQHHHQMQILMQKFKSSILTLDSSGEKPAMLRIKKRWRKPWEELQRRHPSPRTDRHAIDVACTGKEQQKYSLQISAAWVTPTPLHHGDLEGGTPRKIISRKTVKIRVKRHSIWQKYRYKEIV